MCTVLLVSIQTPFSPTLVSLPPLSLIYFHSDCLQNFWSFTRMHASPASVTPRGTPSRRGKSPLVGGHSPSGSASGSASQPSDSLMKPPNSTFTSSLDISVQGAVPINPDSDDERESLVHQSSHSLQTPTGDSKRAPRKSKTDALAALHNHAIASSGEDMDMPSGESAIRYNNNGRPIPVSPVLDMASVKTDAPRELPANGPRPFGLEDCPSFYPTKDEFKDPMAYVRSISEVAQNYGICKVIPPVGWKMPFVTDTEVHSLLLSLNIFADGISL